MGDLFSFALFLPIPSPRPGNSWEMGGPGHCG